MKRHLLILCILLGLVGTRASAYDFEVNGIYYTVTSKTGLTVEVTSYFVNYGVYSGSITIPNSVAYEGKTYSVTRIGEKAFYDCKELTSITLPNSVTSIGEGAFFDCTSLTSIKLPNSLTNIGGNAFNGCSNLTSIDIPQSVTSIGGMCFEGCSKFTSIVIPQGVNSLESRCFYGCSSLTSVTVLGKIKDIGISCFENCTALKSINFPSGFESGSITNDAFKNCTSLSTLVFSGNLLMVGSEAFAGCSNLTSIEFPECFSMVTSMFNNCTKLSTIILKSNTPPYVSDIGDGTLTPSMFATIILKVPQGTSSVYRNSSFWKNFSNIQERTDSGSPVVFVSTISLDKSSHTMSVGDVVTLTATISPSNATNKTLSWKSDNTTVATVDDNGKVTAKSAGTVLITATSTDGSNISETCTITINSNEGSGGGGSISYYDFEKNGIYYFIRNTTDLQVGVTYGPSPYNGNVVIPSTVTHEGKTYTVTEIGSESFMNCISLNSIEFPNNLTDIGTKAFYGCTKLQSLKFPSSISQIYHSAFENCSGIISLQFSKLNDAILSIYDAAFRNCTSLTSFVSPDGPIIDYGWGSETAYTVICPNVFYGCTNLTTVEFNITHFYASSLAECPNLRSITLKGTLYPPSVFNDYTLPNKLFTSATLYVPNDLVDSYKTHNYWKQFTNIRGIDISGGDTGGDEGSTSAQDRSGFYSVSYDNFLTDGNTYPWTPPTDFTITIDDDGTTCYISNIFGKDVATFLENRGLPFTYTNKNTAVAGDEEGYYFFYRDYQNSGYIIARPGNDDYLYLDVNITFDESGKIYFGDLYILIFPYDSSTDSYPNGTAIYVYKNLVATKIASSIEQPISNTYVKCHVSGSSIILSEEFFVQVYNTTGGLVYTGVTSRVDNLSKGMYIVKMGDKTQKVIIK